MTIEQLCAGVTPDNSHRHVDSQQSIEQLAANYRAAMAHANALEHQAQEARDACDKALAELEGAFKALGFEAVACNTPVSKPALKITCHRDLRKGDLIRCVGASWSTHARGSVMVVRDIDESDAKYPILINGVTRGNGEWGKDFEFISRP